MTKKRRAKSGESRLFTLDVIAYHYADAATLGWLIEGDVLPLVRVTVRDRETGRTAEHSSLFATWALFRAVRKLTALKNSPDAMIDRLETAARELGTPPIILASTLTKIENV